MPYTREACLRALDLDPSSTHDTKDITAAYRKQLFRYHPDSGGSAACPYSLNRVIHAHNLLSHTGQKAFNYTPPQGAWEGWRSAGSHEGVRGAYGGARGDFYTNHHERDPW